MSRQNKVGQETLVPTATRGGLLENATYGIRGHLLRWTLGLSCLSLLTGCTTIRSSRAEMALLKQKPTKSLANKDAGNLPMIVDVSLRSTETPSAILPELPEPEVTFPVKGGAPALFPLVSKDVAPSELPVIDPAIQQVSATENQGPVLPTSYTAQEPAHLPATIVNLPEENQEAPVLVEVVPGLADLTMDESKKNCEAFPTTTEEVVTPETIYFDSDGEQIEPTAATEQAGHVTISPAEQAKEKAQKAIPSGDLEAVSETELKPLPMDGLNAVPEGAIVPPPPVPMNSTAEKAIVEEYSAPPSDQVRIVEEAAPVRIVGVYGVSEDRSGIADNLSTRIGATYYQLEDSGPSSGGVTGMLEGSDQIHSTPFFIHGGIASEMINNEYPVGFSIGMSRLATIEGGRVVRPWIFSATYDGYFDTTFFETNDTVYLDQVRGLIGYAIKPWIDVGVWGAAGLGSDFGVRSQSGALFNVTGRFANRVASYAAFDVWNCHVILSGGWEEGPGTTFAEADAWVPLTRSCNLFGGAGYSDSGAADGILGLEFKFGYSHPWLRHFKSKFHSASYASADGCLDPCNPSCCEEVVCCYCDPCAPRYRGGWANDPYRGALRVISPSRMRRMLEDPTPRLLPPVVANEPPPAAGGNEPPPVDPVVEEPGGVDVDPQKPCGCEEGHPPRVEFRPTRDSRLAQWLQEHKGATPGTTAP